MRCSRISQDHSEAGPVCKSSIQVLAVSPSCCASAYFSLQGLADKGAPHLADRVLGGEVTRLHIWPDKLGCVCDTAICVLVNGSPLLDVAASLYSH